MTSWKQNIDDPEEIPHEDESGKNNETITSAVSGAVEIDTAAAIPIHSESDSLFAEKLQTINQLISIFQFSWQQAQDAVDVVGPDITLAYNFILDQGGEDRGGAIVPIRDCPHWKKRVKIDKDDDISFCFRSPIGCTYLNEEDVAKTGKRKSAMDEEGKCPDGENWICLECKAIRCSRYVNGHCEDHWKNTKCDEISTMKQDESEAMGHCIALSLQDLSVWCYECNSYLVHDDLELIVNKFECEKFRKGENSAHENTANESEVVTNKHPYLPKTLGDLADFIKSDDCQSIIILAGAGMSRASGIPDFRSAGGLYDTLEPDKLTANAEQKEMMRLDPSAVFDKHLFLQNPLPCLECKRPFILGTQQKKWKATLAHRFIELLHVKTGKLTRLYTQNIDGLERQCDKLPKSFVVPVHGSMDRIACELPHCQAEMDYDEFCELMTTQIKDITGCDDGAPESSTPIKCKSCNYFTVKPTVVLFHAKLPALFFESIIDDLPKADLLIIIGTSLGVGPANSIVYHVPDDCLRVVINNEPVGQRLGIDYSDEPNRDYFARGSSENILMRLMYEMGWLDDLTSVIDDLPERSKEILQQYLNEDKEV